MTKSETLRQVIDGVQLFEDIKQIYRNCQVCGERLRAGERVVAYVFRPCPHSVWVAGQVRCVDHPLSLESMVTLGVCEAVLSGRVGRCVDQAYQNEWPVLLDPVIEGVSPRETTAAVGVPSVTVEDVTECPVAESALERRAVLRRAEVA
ncbi:hypothetical protein [Halobellus inordinatus]|uniref:hypothetical protein n=1 Tax=Halobellus inordinatus TaxID=1126236 RepID=UPI00210CAC0D|nr:hypothetical protein [Halobellus inordinatus]